MFPMRVKPHRIAVNTRVHALDRWFTIVEQTYQDAWQTHYKVKEQEEPLILNNNEEFEIQIPGLLS